MQGQTDDVSPEGGYGQAQDSQKPSMLGIN
jgi:hypothetical protein